MAKWSTEDHETLSPQERAWLEQIKATSKFLACVKVDYWFKYNHRVLLVMENLNNNQNCLRDNDRKVQNHDNSTGNSFFVHEVSSRN